jgi:hypothetical protein
MSNVIHHDFGNANTRQIRWTRDILSGEVPVSPDAADAIHRRKLELLVEGAGARCRSPLTRGPSSC